MPLSREQVLLSMVAMVDGAALTPVQIQKALFLATDKASRAFARNSRYDFQPYDYGPFDRQVYVDAEDLSRQGLMSIVPGPENRWNTYAATPEGVTRGRQYLRQLNNEQREILERILDVVRSLSFTELVSAIYRAYPPMRVNSVFRD